MNALQKDDTSPMNASVFNERWFWLAFYALLWAIGSFVVSMLTLSLFFLLCPIVAIIVFVGVPLLFPTTALRKKWKYMAQGMTLISVVDLLALALIFFLKRGTGTINDVMLMMSLSFVFLLPLASYAQLVHAGSNVSEMILGVATVSAIVLCVSVAYAPRFKASIMRIIFIFFVGITLAEPLFLMASISPTHSPSNANNAWRHSDVLTLLNAVYQYKTDTHHLPAGIPLDTPKEICKTTVADCTGFVDLRVLKGDYVIEMPVDPATPNGSVGTSYFIMRNSADHVTISASLAKKDPHPETIEMTR